MVHQKDNRTTYFMKALRTNVGHMTPWGQYIQTTDFNVPPCYYIGTFPNYWNTVNNWVAYAHDLQTPDTWAMPNRVFLPDVSYIEAYKWDKDDMELFIGKEKTAIAFKQKEYFDRKKLHHEQ